MTYPLQKFVLFDIDYTLFDTDNFKTTGLTSYRIYDEVADILEKISKISQMGIISKGESGFQEKKLNETGILKYFPKENIHIATDKDKILEETLDRYSNKKLFLVDDKIQILKSAKELVPSVFTIWVKRGPFVEIMKDVEYKPDAVIDNLDGVVDIISQTPSN